MRTIVLMLLVCAANMVQAQQGKRPFGMALLITLIGAFAAPTP